MTGQPTLPPAPPAVPGEGQPLPRPADVPLLSAVEEVELAHAIEAGVLARERLDAGVADPRLAAELAQLVYVGGCAFERMVLANVRLMRFWAARRMYAGGAGTLSFEDLVSEGVELVHGADQAEDWCQAGRRAWRRWECGAAVARLRLVVRAVDLLTAGDRRFERIPGAAAIATAAGVPVGLVRDLLAGSAAPIPAAHAQAINRLTARAVVDLFDTVGSRGRLVMSSAQFVDAAPTRHCWPTWPPAAGTPAGSPASSATGSSPSTSPPAKSVAASLTRWPRCTPRSGPAPRPPAVDRGACPAFRTCSAPATGRPSDLPAARAAAGAGCLVPTAARFLPPAPSLPSPRRPLPCHSLEDPCPLPQHPPQAPPRRRPRTGHRPFRTWPCSRRASPATASPRCSSSPGLTPNSPSAQAASHLRRYPTPSRRPFRRRTGDPWSPSRPPARDAASAAHPAGAGTRRPGPTARARDHGTLVDLAGGALRPRPWCTGTTLGETCPRSMSCPTCDQGPGSPCTGPSGHVLSAGFGGTYDSRRAVAERRDRAREAAVDPDLPAPWPALQSAS